MTMAKQRKPKHAATAKPAPRKPGACPGFKAFYRTVVPAAMRYALRNTDFSTAQLVTQALAWTFWQSGVEGAEAAATLIESPAIVFEAMLRTEIVAEWRRARHAIRAPRGPHGGSPPSPDVAAIAGYFACRLSPKAEARMEARLERDGDFFELVAPIVMQWRVPRGVIPERLRDYRMPERAVELMWASFCEEASPA
jgi:hypothetical protein